jgi:hypothetical protein
MIAIPSESLRSFWSEVLTSEPARRRLFALIHSACEQIFTLLYEILPLSLLWHRQLWIKYRQISYFQTDNNRYSIVCCQQSKMHFQLSIESSSVHGGPQLAEAKQIADHRVKVPLIFNALWDSSCQKPKRGDIRLKSRTVPEKLRDFQCERGNWEQAATHGMDGECAGQKWNLAE